MSAFDELHGSGEDRTIEAASASADAVEASAAGHGPVLDVLDDMHHEHPLYEEDGEAHAAPLPPTGDGFGVATPVRPPGLSKNTLAIVGVGACVFLLLLVFGITFGIVSKTSAQHAVAMGDATKKKPFASAPGAGLVAPEAFGTPVPNGTPKPYNPLARGTQNVPANPYATATPFAGGLGRAPVCQVQAGYAGPPQPGCPAQQRTAPGTQAGTSTYQTSGTTTYTQSTPSPAQIAEQHQRDQEAADVQTAAQAGAFVNDTQNSASQSNSGEQGAQGAVGTQFATAQQQLEAQRLAAQQRFVAQQQQQYAGTPAATPPPANYLNVGVGTWMPITTIGQISCSLNGGGVVAQVNAPGVYDSTGTYLLVPPFSKVVGQTFPVSNGHCDVAWTTLRLPNGAEVSLRSYHSQDAHGQSGIGGTRDDHRWSIARTGVYAAAVAAAAGYIMARSQQQGAAGSGAVVITQTSPTQQAITAAIGPVQSAADKIIGMDANRPVDVHVPDGTHLNLYVDSPIYLPPWQQ